MMVVEKSIHWTKNKFKSLLRADSPIQEVLPAESPLKVHAFYKQLPGYWMSPLKRLSNLVAKVVA